MKRLEKTTVKSLVIFLVLLVIFNVISFAVPFVHTSTFWGAYIFGMIAIVSQIAVVFLTINGTDSLRKLVYAYPVFRMGMIYMVIQLIVSLAFSVVASFVDKLPGWIIYVVSIVILGVFVILVLLTDLTKEEVIQIEEEEERQTVQMKTFRINIDSTMRRVEDAQLLKKLEKLSDIARYSDPVSCTELYVLENEITEKLGELDSVIKLGDISYAKILTEQVIDLFEDRNAQCKVYKRK